MRGDIRVDDEAQYPTPFGGTIILDTISILEKLGADRHRTTVHRWVQKADVQPTDGIDRITSRPMKPWLSSIQSDIGCTLMSIPTGTACSTFCCVRRETTGSPRCFSQNSVRNISLPTQFSSTTVLHGTGGLPSPRAPIPTHHTWESECC